MRNRYSVACNENITRENQFSCKIRVFELRDCLRINIIKLLVKLPGFKSHLRYKYTLPNF